MSSHTEHPGKAVTASHFQSISYNQAYDRWINGSLLPEFETDEAHDYFITRLFIREGFYDYEDDEQHGSPIFEKGAKKCAKKGLKSEELQRRIEDVYHAICDNPGVKNSDLESIIGATKRQIETAVKTLQDNGRIHREDGNRKGKWIID